jgi:DnaJ domain
VNPYQVLGILPYSSPTQIKAAYRRAAASHHPDRGGSHEAMVTINAAYEQLTGIFTNTTRSKYPHQNSPPPTPTTLTQWLALYNKLLLVVERRGYKRGWIMYRLIELQPPLAVWQLHGQMMGYKPSFALYHWNRQQQASEA